MMNNTIGKKLLHLLKLLIGLRTQMNSQSLKIYSGEFMNGRAKYTYKEIPEKGRIYEGFFIYTAKGIHITGNYKDNKKNGLWIYKLNGQSLKVNYAQGMLNGDYTYQNPEAWFGESKASLHLKMNRIVGAINISGFPYKASYGILSGQYNENGYPEGKWILNTKPYNGIKIYHVIYANGSIIKSFEEDITTGDIHSKEIPLAYLVTEFLHKREDIKKIIERGHISFKAL